MIVSSGIGSGLDIGNLVQQLVDAERAPAANRLGQREARAQAKLSALGVFRAALTNLQNAAKSLGDAGAFSSFKAQSENPDRFTATAGSDAAAGSYQIEVLSLASAHKLASGPFSGRDAAVGYGTLTISVGGANFDVQIDSAATTLTDIRDAINLVGEDAGFAANLVTTDDGTRLVLNAANSGAASALRVTSSGGDGGLTQLVYDPGVLTNLSEVEPAVDGQIRVDGFLASSADNTYDGVIQGLTISALESEPGVSYGLDVLRDDDAVVRAVQDFVKAYNNFTTTVRNLSGVDSEGNGSVFTGDALLRSTNNQLRSLVGGRLASGPLGSLAELGISFDSSGTMSADSEKLTAALAQEHGAVAAFFTGDDGLAARLDRQIDALVESGGTIASREDGLEAGLERIADQRAALDRRIERIAARYQAQFAALDSLIAQLRTTSEFLSSQLANLPGPRSSGSGN